MLAVALGFMLHVAKENAKSNSEVRCAILGKYTDGISGRLIDLIKVRNYYIACGYTDLRMGIDGLGTVVIQQHGSHLDEESLFRLYGR